MLSSRRTNKHSNQSQQTLREKSLIRSFLWSAFSCIRTEYGEILHIYLSVFSPNAGKYGPENPPYLDTFHAV